MPRIFRCTPAPAWFGLVLAASFGCQGDPCADLEEQCGACPGSGKDSELVEQTCRVVLNADDEDACEAALDNDFYQCP